MLIQKIVATAGAVLSGSAFRFCAAKPGAIGSRLLLRLLAGGLLPELSQIDQISHAVLHHAFHR